MAHGKSAKRSNNKKKGKNRSQQSQTSQQNVTPQTTSNDFNLREIPMLESFRVPASKSQIPDRLDSIYIRYKKATQRFKDALQSMVPPKMFDSDKATSLLEAVDYIAANGLEVEATVLNDLKLAIRIRQRVSVDKFQGGDAGHSYFVAVLVYCWSVLVPLRKKVQMVTKSKQQTNEDEMSSNRFTLLSLGNEDEDDPEEDMPCGPVIRPVEAGPVRLTLQQLISGTDRMDCILFLMSLDELMKFVALHYSKLKEASLACQRLKDPPLHLVEQIMEGAVATNFAIQQVSFLEQEFVANHPHMNTVYRLLATLVLVEFVDRLTKIVSRESPIASRFSDKDATMFIGDLIECQFRAKSDPHNKAPTIVEEFLQQWKISNSSEVEEIFRGVRFAVVREVPLKQESGMNSHMFQLANSVGYLQSHSWLPQSSHIGMNRSILHTIRLLQGLSSAVVSTNGRLLSKTGYFGSPWGDNPKQVSKIQVDMDELLMGEILPALVNMCYEGLLSQKLPRQNELLTFFVHIKSFVKNPERPVSWSLGFAIHALLTSILEVQLSNQWQFLSNTAEQAFNIYSRQIEKFQSTHVTEFQRRPYSYETNIRTLYLLRLLVEIPMKASLADRHPGRSVWNPLCSGLFLSYIAYFGNLEGGSLCVDSVSQLRMVLHLYNALTSLGEVKPGQVPLLDWLHTTFQNSKAVWEGPLPVQGQFQTRWWVSFGMSIKDAQRHGERKKTSNALLMPKVQEVFSTRNITRDMTAIEPEQLAKSYRRICLHDFTGVEDKYHSPTQRRDLKNTDSYKYAVRTNDTLDAMEIDERLLATNLVSLGYYLNQFIVSLFRVLGWMPVVNQFVSETPSSVKQGRRVDGRAVAPNSWEASDDNARMMTVAFFFAHHLLGSFDCNNDPSSKILAERCAEFMQIFFNSVPPENVMWFVAHEGEEEEEL